MGRTIPNIHNNETLEQYRARLVSFQKRNKLVFGIPNGQAKKIPYPPAYLNPKFKTNG